MINHKETRDENNQKETVHHVGLYPDLLSLVCTLILLGTWIGGAAVAQGATLYVAPGGNCGSGAQDAVDAASTGDEIRVAAGTYTDINQNGGLKQVVYIDKTVTIRGGYTTTDWNSSDPEANPTILDAQGQGRVLYIIGNISPTIEGLRITGGDGTGLGGGQSGQDVGGGLHLFFHSDATLNNHMIADNHCSIDTGAGLDIRGSSPHLRHNTIARNSGGDGSGVYVTNFGGDSSTVSLTNTILVGHTVGINVTAGNTATLEGTLWGSATWANGTDWSGDGTINHTNDVSGDPAFVDPDNGDYHIGLKSAVIDAGIDAGVTTDIDDDTRPQGAGYDIGADERRCPSLEPILMLLS